LKAEKNGQPEHLTTLQVAKLCLVSPKTIERWEDEGKIPRATRTIGGHRRWRFEVIAKALQDHNDQWNDPVERKRLREALNRLRR
jgi:MerR-like DNA binding protein